MVLNRITTFRQWRELKKLYIKAFPSYERKPLPAVLLVMYRKKADVWIVENEGEFAGFAITMNGADLVLLDYFAISEEKRDGGMGSRVLRMLQEQYRGKRLFLEIENVYAASDNPEERCRRKQFYCRNGMQEMKIMVNAFGAELELLTYDCRVSYEEYYTLYCSCYGKWAARNIKQIPYPV